MSSLIRRLQIRAMQGRGYVRTKYVLAQGPNRTVRQEPVKQGGLILNSDSEPVGYSWPRLLPKSANDQGPAAKKPRNKPRGSRRGKPSTWRRAS